jgi:peroxiredoxin
MKSITRNVACASLIAVTCCGPPASRRGAAEPVRCEPAPPPPPGEVDLSGMPDFTLDRHDGMGSVNLHQLAGENVIALAFWATWCDACQVELPQLQALWEKYRDAGFVVLAITMDNAETVSEVPANVDRLGVTFPVLLDTESQATGAYNPRMAAPLFLLFDRRGERVYSHEGFMIADVQEMEEQIAAALGCR